MSLIQQSTRATAARHRPTTIEKGSEGTGKDGSLTLGFFGYIVQDVRQDQSLRAAKQVRKHGEMLSDRKADRDWYRFPSNRNKTDLLKQLHELKTELASLRVQKIAGGSAAKLTKM